MLETNEKTYLIILVIAIIILVFISIYLCKTRQVEKYTDIVNHNIYILSTNGQGKEMLEKMSKEKKKVTFDLDYFQPYINSSDISPQVWSNIADGINKVYDTYDAFIIIQGDETIAYTASALAFMFENLDKPVVLCNHHDIATSIEYVSRLSIPEVVVIRNKHILRGVRVSDPSFPPLGKVDKDIEIRMDEVLKANGKGMRYIPFTKKHYVIVIKLFPGINAKYLENILSKQNVNGIVFETFGQDSHPTDKMFLKELIKLSQKGILMVNIHGGDLSKFGVIKGSDMTVDAALAKLYYIITTCKPEIAKQVLLSPLRGELTPPVSNVSIS